MTIKFAGKTDIGLVRTTNEDSINLLPDKQLFIVCDGMGGHNAGEVASSSACAIIGSLYARFFDRLLSDEQLRLPRVFPPSTDVLTKTVRIANHDIYRRSSSDSSLSGMGTTIVAVAFEKDIITLLHVGDSRIYRFFNKNLTPLTVDHSWAAELEQSEQITAEEAKNLVNRNVITRALGVRDSVEIDVAVRKVIDGDIYILCSDGLCGYIEDNEIRQVVKGCGDDLDKIVAELIRMANDRGGMDNVSVIALQVNGKAEKSEHQEMDTVTVDGEPAEYYQSEEQWASSASVPAEPTAETDVETGGGFGKFAAFAVVLITIAVVFYFIFRG
jgi:serine/threonine protein phosphatase PrpC